MRIHKKSEVATRAIHGLTTAMLTIGLLVGPIASPASAQITITACVNAKSGAVTFISQGACKKGTNPVVLNPPPAITTLTVQKLNVVDGSNKTVATLGKDSNGNLLTFFDSSGKKAVTVGVNPQETFAGAAAWDNNNVIAGNGSVRTTWGEANPNLAPNAGFGVTVDDDNGTEITGIGATYNLLDNGLYFQDQNGVRTGMGVFHSNGYAGYYVNDSTQKTRQFSGYALDNSYNNVEVLDSTGAVAGFFIDPVNFKDFGYFLDDLNGANRQFVGASLDGTSFNVMQVADTNSAPRAGTRQGPINGFFTSDSNGILRQSLGAKDDGSAVLYNTTDRNGKTRTGDGFTDQFGPGYSVFDALGNTVSHLP